MLGQAKGLFTSRKAIIILIPLILLAGLLTARVVATESEEDNAIALFQQLELSLLEVLLNELDDEPLQEVMEALENWMEDHPEACPELRAVVEAILEDHGQGGAFRESTLRKVSASNNNDSNNNSRNSNGNNPTGSSGGDEGSVNSPPGGDDSPSPMVPCDDHHWMANTQPVYMLGTPGFWTSRHRCLLCNFITTCKEEARYHAKNYYFEYCEPSQGGGYASGDPGSGGETRPPCIWDYNPHYKYTPGVPGVVIYLPDGTYICLNCGKIKQSNMVASGE